MRLRLVLAALMLCSPALAQQHPTTFLAPLGYQQYTSLASATALTNIPAKASMAMLCAETQQIRWRDDGTSPTSTVGMPIAIGQCVQYYGKLGSLQFIQSAASAVLDVSYYQ
jgi:hypothetical protein